MLLEIFSNFKVVKYRISSSSELNNVLQYVFMSFIMPAAELINLLNAN